MSITAVPNSPIGWSDAAQSAFQCEDSDYCQPLAINTLDFGAECLDLFFQLQFGKVGHDLLMGRGLDSYLTGTCTIAGVNQLIDTGAAFATPPVVTSSYVVNTATGQFAIINSVAAATALNIGADIFTVAEVGDAYALVDIRSIIGTTTPDGISSVRFAPNTGANAFQIFDAYPNTTNRFVVEVDITDYAGGKLVVQNGNGVAGFQSLDSAYTATSNGTHSFYGIPSVGTRLRIVDATEEASYTITGIRIYYTSIPRFRIFQDNTSIFSFDPYQYIHNRALFELLLCETDIAESFAGCYQVYADNIAGLIGLSTFPIQTNPPWEFANIGTGWAFSANELVHTSGGSVGTNTATYNFTDNLSTKCNYVIYFQTDGGNIPSVSLELTDGDLVNISAFLSGGPDYYISFYGYAAKAIVFSATEVDNVTIQLFNTYNTFYNEIGGYFTPVSSGDVLQFRIAPNFCTLSALVCFARLDTKYVLFESTITNNSASPVKKKNRWLPASTTYTERCFVRSSLRFARWQDDDFESYRDSDGASRVVYSDPVEVKECQLFPVPASQHAWMVWALRNDFRVNGDPYYVIDGSYSPNWQRESTNASAVFEMAAQDQNIKTTGCD